MVHEERRIRNALQTPHKLISFSFETEEYVFLVVFVYFLFRVLRYSFSFLLREKGHAESGRLGATRGGSDPPVVILIYDLRSSGICQPQQPPRRIRDGL